MKHIFFFLTILCCVAGLRADESAAYKLNVQNFSELTVVDGVAVDYYCQPDSAGWAVFSCTPDKAASIMFENKAERLTVRSAADEKTIDGLPRIKVYSASLHKVENSGDSIIRVYKPVHIDSFHAKQIGNGAIEIYGLDADDVDAGVTAGKGGLSISGKADKAKLRNVGAGLVDASALTVRQANCYVFGSGDVYCNPSDQLRIYGAGSGKIYHFTTPAKIANRGIGVKAHSSDEIER